MGWRDFQAAPPREFMESMEIMTIGTPLIPLIPLIPIEAVSENRGEMPVTERATDAAPLARPWISWEVMTLGAADTPGELPFPDADLKPVVVYPEGHIWHKWYETPVPTATASPVRTCYACKGVDHWLSIHGLTICRKCHPPAPGAERIAE